MHWKTERNVEEREKRKKMRGVGRSTGQAAFNSLLWRERGNETRRQREEKKRLKRGKADIRLG